MAIQQLDAAALACVMLTCNARYVSTTFYEGLLLGKLGYSHHSRYTSTESKHTALGYAVVVANAHAEDNPVGSLRVIATLLGAGVDPTAMSWVAPNLNWLDRTPADYLSVPLCVLGASNVQPFPMIALFFRAGYNPVRHPRALDSGMPLVWQDEGAKRRAYVYRERGGKVRRHIWPHGWRHWHCSRAATALLGVGRRLRSRSTYWSREFAWLLAQAVMQTRFAQEWELTE